MDEAVIAIRAQQEETQARKAVELIAARDVDSFCYIERFGRIPYRYLLEAFERYAEDMRRQVLSASPAFNVLDRGDTPADVPPSASPGTFVPNTLRRRRTRSVEPSETVRVEEPSSEAAASVPEKEDEDGEDLSASLNKEAE